MRPPVDDIWMTGAARFVTRNVARRRFRAAGRKKSEKISRTFGGEKGNNTAALQP
jgi:hypothetical protein